MNSFKGIIVNFVIKIATVNELHAEAFAFVINGGEAPILEKLLFNFTLFSPDGQDGTGATMKTLRC